MLTAVLAGRLLLAGVFLAAGLGKLIDRDGSRSALADFGMPPPLIRLGVVALPVAELATAVALVLASSAQAGAMGAAGLLLVFTIGIANALTHGREPDCHCFGQIHSAPAGTGTLARNGALLVLALFLSVWGPGPAIDTWMSERSPSELSVSGVIAALVLTAAVLALLVEHRRRARTRARWEQVRKRSGLPIGSLAPRFELPGACGPSVSLDSLCARGRPVLVVFADVDCCACEALLPHVSRWQQALARQLTIPLISDDEKETARRVLCERYGIADVLLQSDFGMSDTYLTRGTPSAVIVGSDGVVLSDTATGYGMIHALVRLALRRAATGARVLSTFSA